jgi:hypothetical protein
MAERPNKVDKRSDEGGNQLSFRVAEKLSMIAGRVFECFRSEVANFVDALTTPNRTEIAKPLALVAKAPTAETSTRLRRRDRGILPESYRPPVRVRVAPSNDARLLAEHI